jgi:hypothetical protein
MTRPASHRPGRIRPEPQGVPKVLTIPEITITGFPKCGTTALLRRFSEDAEMHVIRSTSGAYEVPWPQIRDVPQELPEGRIVAHKFAAYVYSRAAVQHLVARNAGSVIVLCVRDPLLSLISWHNMHRAIARAEKPSEHFAWLERDFYADCAIDDYYHRFARMRLRYDHYLNDLLGLVPTERLVVVSQERMARGMEPVADYLKGLARSAPVPLAEAAAGEARVHVGYGDRASEAVGEAIRAELAGVHQRLGALIETRVRHRCL